MTFMKKTKNAETGDKRSSVKSLGKILSHKWLIGIDEVGRGPLAGPVTVGAVAVMIEEVDLKSKTNDKEFRKTYANLRKKLMEISDGINADQKAGHTARQIVGPKKEYPIGIDSKKMKESDRDFWYEIIKECEKTEDSFHISVQSKSATDIDKKGIAVCIADLVDLNIKKILSKIQKIEPNVVLRDLHVLLDGSLKTKLQVGNQKTIIKGDEKEMVISLASVYAKVIRDTYMKNLSKNPKYSQYGFEVHKGYGTLNHRQVISKYGMSDEHRKNFCGRC
jgi:ribonuclease HII